MSFQEQQKIFLKGILSSIQPNCMLQCITYLCHDNILLSMTADNTYISLCWRTLSHLKQMECQSLKTFFKQVLKIESSDTSSFARSLMISTTYFHIHFTSTEKVFFSLSSNTFFNEHHKFNVPQHHPFTKCWTQNSHLIPSLLMLGVKNLSPLS